MTNMQEIYNNMSNNNIIDEDNYLIKLMEIYKKSGRPTGTVKDRGTRNSDFYDVLTKSENNDMSKVVNSDYQQFYVRMTNNWIKNILSLTESDLNYFDNNGLEGYRIIRDILLKTPQVRNTQDIADLYNKMSNKIDPFDINEKNYFWCLAQLTYGFNPQAAYVGDFIHINSRYGSARKSDRVDVEYRLYIDCANEDIFNLCSAYVDSCEKLGIPYYFKFQTNGKRQDKFLVYCSGDQLKNNIEILKNIAKQHPEIVQHCGPRMELLGNIDNWIGLASEPENSKLKHKHSFNTLRAEIFEDAAEEVILNFIDDNINKEVIIDGKKEKFNNIILNVAVEQILGDIAKQKKVPVSQITSPKFVNYIKTVLVAPSGDGKLNNIRKGFNRLREVVPRKNELMATNGASIFDIATPYGDSFGYSIRVADEIIKSMVDIMQKCDTKYLEKYRKAIKDKCSNYGVDPANFALNSGSLEQFKKMESSNTNGRENTSIFRRELDKSILNNIRLKIYNYLKASNLSNADDVMQRMNLVGGLYVENLKETRGSKMVSRGNPNEIAIDVQFVQFDNNNNPIGLDPNLSKLIESQLGHELLHSGARVNGKTGIMNSNNERGLNEGFTQLITENIFGYTVSNNTDGYRYLKKFAKILEATFGKQCILESYFGNSLELQNKMNAIVPNYYNNFNKYLTIAYYSKKDSAKLFDLMTRDMIFNVVIPALKTKSPEDANNYIKNISLYFVDNFQYSVDFLSYLDEYINMEDAKKKEQQGYLSRDLEKENTRLEFYYACEKTDDIRSIIKLSPDGTVMANYNNASFLVNDNAKLDIIYSKYYEQVVIGDAARLSNIEKIIVDKLVNDDYDVVFKDSKSGDIVYKRAVVAYFKKIASNNGFEIRNNLDSIGDVKQIKLDVVKLNNGNQFDFSTLKDLIDKYDFVYPDKNNPQRYEIREKNNGKLVENTKIKNSAVFAHLWLSSFGQKRMINEKYAGETYAFSEFSEKVYNEMCSIVQEQMKKNGTIDVDDLCSKLEKGRSFHDVHIPIATMFKNPMSTDIVYQYFSSLIPKEDYKLETEATRIYNHNNVDYRGYIEMLVDEMIPSSNESVYEELYNELARDNMPTTKTVKDNSDYYRLFVAAADGVANAISVENEVLIADAFNKLQDAENKIAKENIRNLDFNNATADQKIQYCLARMKHALKNKDINSYDLYRDKYNNVINGVINGLGKSC